MMFTIINIFHTHTDTHTHRFTCSHIHINEGKIIASSFRGIIWASFLKLHFQNLSNQTMFNMFYVFYFVFLKYFIRISLLWIMNLGQFFLSIDIHLLFWVTNSPLNKRLNLFHYFNCSVLQCSDLLCCWQLSAVFVPPNITMSFFSYSFNNSFSFIFEQLLMLWFCSLLMVLGII